LSVAISIFWGILLLFFLSKKALINKLQLQLFFPSWRFFEKVGPISQFYYRISNDGENFGEWQIYQSQILRARSLKELFINPEENYYLFVRANIDKFVLDINELDLPMSLMKERIRGLVSYQILVNLTQTLVIKIPENSSLKMRMSNFDTRDEDNVNIAATINRYFQFKLGVAWLNKTPIAFEDVFISDIHEVKSAY
jgi:hypothetical protein